MKVKEMHQMVMDLVGLEFMPEDSGIVFDNEKEVKFYRKTFTLLFDYIKME